MLAYIVAQFTGQRQPVVQAGSPKARLRRKGSTLKSFGRYENIFPYHFFYGQNSIMHSSEMFPGTPALLHKLVVTFEFLVFAYVNEGV